MKQKKLLSGAMLFILLMGVVSLFSDMTHEGARGILGAYLDRLGASAALIGFVSGAGELLGYSLRLLSGMLADRKKNYWTLIVVGYAMQVLAIPALALVPENGLPVACALILAERVGKAIKKPAKNTLVSFAAAEVGTGRGFAAQEFLDQLGAFLGPILLYAIALVRKTHDGLSTYRVGFAALGIPALITISLVLYARMRYPHPETFERTQEAQQPFTVRRAFVFYMAAIALFAFGFADFPLITLHAARAAVYPEDALALLYAGAMAADAIAALLFGRLFDRIGLGALMLSTALSALFPPLAFLTKSPVVMAIGIALWGVGIGAQESIMKAAVSRIVPPAMRGTGFGIFETGFGVAWFLGSWLLGALYDRSIPLMVAVSVLAQAAAIPLYALCERKKTA